MNCKSAFLKKNKDSMSKWFVLALIYLLAATAVRGQKNSISYDDIKDELNYGRFRYIEVKGHTGYHLYAGELLNDAVSDGYGSVEIRYGWQPKDPEHWTARYGYSSYGIGYYSGFVGNPQVLGKPNAIFGFITFPLSRGDKRNVFELSQSLGITYNLEPYDAVKNPENDAIGSPFAVYFNLGLGGVYKWTREMDLLYGIDYTHFSNGRITTPNYGFNMYGLNVGLRYHYNADQKLVNNDPYSHELLPARFNRPKKEKNVRLHENSIEIYTAVGTVQNEEDKGTHNRYGIFSGALDYRFKFNTMHAITGGLDLFYDESLEKAYPETKDQFLYGIHAGYDFMFGKMAIRFQYGAYLSDDKGKLPTYIRAGFRYDITDWLSAQIAVKTKNASRADWAEFGLGFRPFKW
jgi:hypothetical protein